MKDWSMPPLRLTNVLQTALPPLSATSRAVVSALACRNGQAPSAGEIAAWVGLRDRHQLARGLRRDGLPPLEQLAGWARVLYWMLEAEARDSSLLELARREQLDPAVAYRLVHRVTGLRWSQVRRAGLTAMLSRFREGCRDRFSSARLRAGAQAGPAVAEAGAARERLGWARREPGWALPRRGSPRHPAAVLTERLPITGSPFDVAVAADGTAYLTRLHAAALECLELAPFRITGSIATGSAPTVVVLSSSSRVAYVTNQFTEDVAVIDLSRRRQTGTIPVPGHPLGAALSPDGRRLYIVTNLDRLCAISIDVGRVVASVPVAQVCTGLAVHPSGRWIYVPTWRAGLILEMDARTLRMTRRFAVGGVPQDLVLSADGLMLYAANEAGWLDRIHLPSGRQVDRAQFGTAAVSLALSPDEAVLYVGLLFAGRVVQLDRPTLRVLARLETGGKPRRIAFDATGRSALIANEAGWVDLVH